MVDEKKTDGKVEPWQEPETTTYQSIACGGCGGELTAVDEKDGKIIRIRPQHLEEEYSLEEMKRSEWELECNGVKFHPSLKASPNWFALAYKNRVYSKNRVKYPLKRVDWEPGGDPEKIHAQNRGISKFERISWDEALDIVEAELRRVIGTYGANSVLCIGEDGHRESKDLHAGGGMHMQVMDKLGGYTRETRTPDSVEGWYWGAKHVWGTGSTAGLGLAAPPQNGFNSWNVILDVTENSDMVIFDAGDWETTQNYACLFLSQLLRFWEEAGKDIVIVDPFCNYTAVCHDNARWVPILPGTDTALDFGIMYVWITENLYDKEYVDTHTVYFDKLKAYVLGDEDGIPKTPAWASERCGVPEWTIKAYARMEGKRTCAHAHYSSGTVKGPYSHEPGRTNAYKLALQGLGKPGVQQVHINAMQVAQETIMQGTVGQFIMLNKCRMFWPTVQSIPRTLIKEALNNGKAKWWGSPSIIMAEPKDQFVEYNYPVPADKGGTKVHLLWSEKPCNMNCWDGGFEYQDAIRTPEVETFITNHQWLENDSLFCDLILPVTTCLEDNDMEGSGMNVSRRHVGFTPPACDRIGESLSDYEIGLKIAERFGVREQIDGGMSEEDWFHYGFQQSRVGEEISYDELKKRGYYFPKIDPNWRDLPVGLSQFYNDPEQFPLDTPTGKIEFWSQALADHFPDDKERTPMARWTVGGPASEGWTHDETLWGERCKQFPLLIVANPGRHRVHAQGDDIMWFREIETCKVRGKDGYMYEPVWLSPVDAAARGIVAGDIVKVFNDRGTILYGARISERITPGAVMVNKGSRVDPIAPHLDRGGAVNLICPANQVSKHCKGFAVTSYLVETSKVTDEEYEGWKRDYPDCFARDYDPAIGINYKSWVVR